MKRSPFGTDPVTSTRAETLGWTRSAQRHAVATGSVQRLRRSVLNAVVATPDPRWESRRQRNQLGARAALLSSPRSTISHQSAAVGWTMPTYDLRERPCLTVPAGTALRRVVDAHLHRATLPDDHVVELDGYPVTSPARTVLDIAREHGVDAGVVAADYALHEKLMTMDELHAAFEVCGTWPGRKAARITLLSVGPAAESVLESISRLRIAAIGLPRPRTQPWITDARGHVLGRCDFFWDEFGVVGEADGDLKYDDGAPAIIEERNRQQEFEETGLVVVRWGWNSSRSFAATAERLRRSFARGARAGSSDRGWGVLREAPYWFTGR